MQLVNKVGVDRQIADERMLIGKGKVFLFAWLADQAAQVFKSEGAGFERLGAGGVYGSARVLLNQSAQAHDGAQRLSSPQFEGALSPLATWLADDRCSTDPIAAGTDNWRMEASGA